MSTAGLAAVEGKVAVRSARVALVDLQVAELAAELQRVFARGSSRSRPTPPGVVRLECRERRHADGEVVEVHRRHGLRKTCRTGWNDPQGPFAGLESEVRQLGEASVRLPWCGLKCA